MSLNLAQQYQYSVFPQYGNPMISGSPSFGNPTYAPSVGNPINRTIIQPTAEPSRGNGVLGLGGLTPWAFTQRAMEMYPMLELTPYEGNTSVPFGQGNAELETILRNLLSGQTGIFRQTLEGDQNMGFFNRAVVVPGQQQLTNQTLPQIRGALSRGPGGGTSPFSGAADEARSRAITDYSNNLANQRLQYDESRRNRALQAGAQLPAYASALDLRRMADSANLDRKINTHFRNQGLAVQEASQAAQGMLFALQAFQTATGVSQYEQAREDQQRMIDDARDNALASSLGSFVGMGLGAFGGPMGASIGSMIGSNIGNVATGGAPYVNPMTPMMFAGPNNTWQSPFSTPQTPTYGGSGFSGGGVDPGYNPFATSNSWDYLYAPQTPIVGS